MTVTEPGFSLAEKIDEIKALLHKFEVEDALLEREGGPRHDLQVSLVRRQHAVELERRLGGLHAADLAALLESLPAEQRMLVWTRIPLRRRGDVLLELSEAVAETMAQTTPQADLVELLKALDADDLAYLEDILPPEVFAEAAAALTGADRQWLRESATYPEDSVGELMEPDVVVARVGETLASVQERLRRRGQLPSHTDKLFVVDPRGVLSGVLMLEDILLNEADRRVGEVMRTRVVSFQPTDEAGDAARAFERYDLISAPVVNARGKLVGRLTVDEVMDFAREEAEIDALNAAGVVQGEDLFANVLDSARNRWLWLSINLVTAFAISRIIGAFEGTIAQLVALASLMPIVASVAGNAGNQTTALVIRSLALDQIDSSNVWHLLRKELSVALLNGAVWGLAVGGFAFLFYHHIELSAVVAVAMMLTFLLAALFGVGAPLFIERLGRDPAMGSSVILTGMTDAMGFFVFLLLASLLLV